MTRCRHCKKEGKNRGKGLCCRCYVNPAVYAMYAGAINRGVADGQEQKPATPSYVSTCYMGDCCREAETAVHGGAGYRPICRPCLAKQNSSLYARDSRPYAPPLMDHSAPGAMLCSLRDVLTCGDD